MLCDSDCTPAACGDGTVNKTLGETCDPNGPHCIDCQIACGNDEVNEGEECDPPGEKCGTDCKLLCGNGILDPAEPCDPTVPGQAPDFCSKDCQVNGLLVFVTDLPHDGNLGGLAGADTVCQTASAKLKTEGATYVAWLSDWQTSAKSRMHGCGGLKYFLPNGTPVADDLESFYDKGPKSPINVTESMQIVSGYVWTATAENGEKSTPACYAWSSNTNDNTAFGVTGKTINGGEWTKAKLPPLICSESARLYCFQQAPANCE